jgi:hypothetical protein
MEYDFSVRGLEMNLEEDSSFLGTNHDHKTPDHQQKQSKKI